MQIRIDVLTYSAMKGFGLGLVLSVLIALGTTQGMISTTELFTNPIVIVMTLLGLGLGFEDPVKV
jgi:hypothetical protein